MLDDPHEAYLRQVARRLRDATGPLTTVYLHGSGAMGGFVPGRSDLDVLAVVTEPLHPPTRERIASELSPEVLRCPARGLEMSVVTLESVRHPTQAPHFELHVATEEGRVDVDDGSGDPDLVMHVAVCRERGRILAGPLGTEVFARAPRVMLLRAFAEEILRGIEHAPPEYAMLNACRSWRFLKLGDLSSKIEGGEWARDRVERGTLVDAALARQRGGAAELDAAEAHAFAASVRDRLLEAAEEA